MSGTGTLILRLEGPLQSWGSRSRFRDRDTGLEPTKSGIVGLISCALGRDRSQSPTDLAGLKMHVRVDAPGKLLVDFHTAGGGVFRNRRDYFAPTSSGSKGKNPVITEKHYLQDASFTVALEGDANQLESIADALQDPVWPLFLGRKSCPPGMPVFVEFSSTDARQKLTEKFDGRCRFIWEVDPSDPSAEARPDVPLDWPNRETRKYGLRYVKSEELEAGK